LHKSSGLYRARIQDGDKRVTVGYYKTPEEASVAYIEYSKQIFKAFHRETNKEQTNE
jgi:hypothetical protein